MSVGLVKTIDLPVGGETCRAEIYSDGSIDFLLADGTPLFSLDKPEEADQIARLIGASKRVALLVRAGQWDQIISR